MILGLPVWDFVMMIMGVIDKEEDLGHVWNPFLSKKKCFYFLKFINLFYFLLFKIFTL